MPTSTRTNFAPRSNVSLVVAWKRLSAVNGYEYDGSTQFELLGWEQIAAELGLVIDLD